MSFGLSENNFRSSHLPAHNHRTMIDESTCQALDCPTLNTYSCVSMNNDNILLYFDFVVAGGIRVIQTVGFHKNIFWR